MDSDELKARNVHRRVQRLKARYSPTAKYDDMPTVLPTGTAADDDDSAPTSVPTSTPAAPATSAPSSASVQPATSNTPAQPATTSAPAATTPSNTPSSANTSSAPADTSSSPNTSSTPSVSTPSSALTSATSTPTTTPSTTPAPAKQTQTAQQQQQENTSTPATVGNSHVSSVTSANPTLTTHVGQLPASGSAAPSPTGSAVPNGGTNAGTIVGIVVAVIVGVVGIVFAVTYFVRRSRKDKDDETFSADAFRRQSTVLPDPEPSNPVVPSRGITPRPPSMIEQRLAQGPPISYQQQFGGNNGYYGYPEQPSFSPGQVVMMSGQPMPPQAWAPTPDSSRPFFSPMGESPMGSPVSVAPYESYYDAQGQLMRQPSMGAASMLNRQPSGGPAEFLNRQPSVGAASQLNYQPSMGPGPYLTRQPAGAGMTLEIPDQAHYVDLNRSSVSPFQAEQYAEISHQLNTAPPLPLPTPLVAAAAEEAITKDGGVMPDVSEPRPLNVVPHPQNSPHGSMTGSPFADPQFQANDIPKPPSPTFSHKTRIDSTPPTLPDMQRSFSPVSIEFPMNAAVSPARPAPSPLSASIEMPAAPVKAHVTNAPSSPVAQNGSHDSAPLTPRPTKDTMPAARPDTVYTVYDDDDAYGGI